MDIQGIIQDKQKYESMYWSKVQECERLKQILKDNNLYQDYNDVQSDKVVSGNIIKLGHNTDYGFISCEQITNLFFHISECKNFQLSTDMINKKVQFTIGRKMGKLQALDIHYYIDSSVTDKMDLFNILDNHNNIPELSNLVTTETVINTSPQVGTSPQVDTSPQTETPTQQKCSDGIQKIEQASDVWYLNMHWAQLRVWSGLLKHNIFQVWNKDNRYKSIFTKLKKDDILCIYVVGKGYISVCRVTGKPRKPTTEDLCLIYKKILDETTIKEHYYAYIFIPVEYLVSMDPSNCVTHKQLPQITDWSSGYRGSACIKPKSSQWIYQVKELYNYMKQQV